MARPLDLWHDLYASRLNWAKATYGEYLQGFPDLQEYFAAHKGEVLVAIYGETQVGKTTLLLTLMGVMESELTRISKLLRGGRSKGRSATATVMRYGKSPDDAWHYKEDGHEQQLDDIELERMLKDLRGRMVAEALNSTEPIDILIPSNAFADRASNRLAVNVLDLPGLNVADSTEQRHAWSLAEKYLRIADLVLLVGQAHRLGFLNPHEFALPGPDWRYDPDRFRVVLTYSTSNDSFKREIGPALTAIDKQQIRQVFDMELRNTLDAASDSFEHLPRVYPLEYGESWDGLRQTDETLYNKLTGVMAELFEELRDDVNQSATEHNRIRHAHKMPQIIEAWKKRRLQDFTEQLETIRTGLEKEQIAKADIDMELKATKAEIINARKSKIDLDQAQKYFDTLFKKDVRVPRDIRLRKIEKTADDFREYLSECKDALRAKLAEAFNDLRREFKKPGMTDKKFDCFDLRESISESLSPGNAVKRLPHYKTNKYWPWKWGANSVSNYREDLCEARQAVRCTERTIKMNARTKFMGVLSEYNMRKEKDEGEACARAELARQGRGSCNDRIQELHEQSNIIEIEKQKFERKISQSLQEVGSFSEHLNAAYKKEFHNRRELVQKAQTTIERFLRLCFALQLQRERDRLTG